MDCIVIFKSISHLDDILPLVFELKKIGFVSTPVFVASTRKQYEFIRENVVLCDGISHIGGRLTTLNAYMNRYIRNLHNIFVLRKYFYKQVLTIEVPFSSSFWVSVLSVLNRRIWKGKKIGAMLQNKPYKQARNITMYYRTVEENFEIREKVVRGYDAVLLSFPKEKYEDITLNRLITDSRVIQVGYTRRLNEWMNYLENNGDKFLSKELRRPYVFFPLSLIGKHLKGENCISSTDKLKEVLLVLKAFNNDILTVFKPHHKTDLEGVKEIIRSIGFRNYIVSYAHPLLLIKHAKFTLTYHSTSMLVEAYLSGCPTVEYAHYDSRFFAYTGGCSRYPECVDYFIHRDKVELRDVLRKLIYEEVIHVKRDIVKLKKDFPILSNQEINDKFSEIM